MHISRTGFSGIDAVVLVQKDAPAELLIGNDVLPKKLLQTWMLSHQSLRSLLGICRSLLTLLEWYIPPKLLECLRDIRSWSRLKSLDLPTCKGVYLLAKEGLATAEAVTSLTTDHCLALVIKKQSLKPMQLDKEQIIDRVSPVFLLSDADRMSPHTELPQCSVNVLQSISQPGKLDVQQTISLHDKDRQSRLLAALSLDKVDLTDSQFKELEALLVEYAGVFALESLEVGSTDLVTHSINTTDHPAIK